MSDPPEEMVEYYTNGKYLRGIYNGDWYDIEDFHEETENNKLKENNDERRND
jgi:hypothetical protein